MPQQPRSRRAQERGVPGSWLIRFAAARNRAYVAGERGNFLAGSTEPARGFGGAGSGGVACDSALRETWGAKRSITW